MLQTGPSGTRFSGKVRTCDRRASGAGHAEELQRRGATIVALAILLPRLNSMIRHKRLSPPVGDYPADEWNVIEKEFRPDFLAQYETVLALGNGYIGMRGCPEEGGPNAENSTLINGFYETWPIVYAEDAYGFAKTGQTILNVTDSKTIKLFVDDEPFWLSHAHLLKYDRRLNMKSGTLDREVIWETPAGKQVLITSRRLVSFPNKHVAAISYRVTLLNAAAHVVISSEMAVHRPRPNARGGDPRQARVFEGRTLHPRMGCARDRRVVLCHGTEKSGLRLTCAIDHVMETACTHAHKVVQTEDFGQVAFKVEAQPECPIELTKYMVYHTSPTASPEELCGRARVDPGSGGSPRVSEPSRIPRGVYGRFLAPQRRPGQEYQGSPREA